MNRLIIMGLVRPIGWIIIGLIVIGIGVFLYASAHVIHPMEIDGQFASVSDLLDNNSYTHTEITLDGSSTTYTFDKNAFTPAWPNTFVKDGKVQLWVDQGTTNIVAFTAYDQSDQNPTMYTSDLYRHPEHGLQNQTTGLITGGAGAAVTLAAIIWAVIAGSRKKAAKQRQPAMVGAGSNADIQRQYGGPPPPMPPGQGQGPASRR